MLEEFTRLFADTDSFFFSFSGDLTNSLQRQMSTDTDHENLPPLWKRADERFFFNKNLMSEVIDLEDTRADPFITPVIQGYIEMQCSPLYSENSADDFNPSPMLIGPDATLPDFFTIAIISRRSRHRAGKNEII